MQRLVAIALQRTEIIGVAKFVDQLLQDFPVSVARGGPVTLRQMFAEMGLNPIVVEQRVVDVEQKDDAGFVGHRNECLI